MEQKRKPIPYEGNEKFIFVSYSHQDMDRVLPLIDRLMKDGFRVWYDDGISPGTEWPEVIAQHINECELFVSFLSNSYMDSLNCKRELDFSIRKRKKFLAVFLEETEMPLGVEMQISTVQAVNYYKTTPELFFERFYNSEVVHTSGCRAEEIRTQEELTAADDGVTSEVSIQSESGKKKVFIPILLGMIVFLGIAGAVIGVGVFKSNKKNTKNTNLRAIELTDVTVTDRVLRKAAKGKDIRQINLENCEISIRDKAVWSEIVTENVTQITITGCGLKDEDAKEILMNAPGLKTLVLKDNELKELSFEQNRNLQNADLSGNQITHIEKTDLEELKVLKLDDNQLSDFTFLETAIHLSTLSAERNNLVSIDSLKNSVILTKVCLADNHITDVSVLGASKDSIEELDLSNNQISDIDSIWPMPVLKRISIDNNNISSLYLTESLNLSYLSARNNQVSSISGDFGELEYIDVANNKLSGGYYFTDCPKLKTGFFENNMISELHLPGKKYANGNFSVYNNPLENLDLGTEPTSYDLYVSYRDEINEILESKIGHHLFLLDCPYDLRADYEKNWGTFYVSFPEESEAAELVKELRK